MNAAIPEERRERLTNGTWMGRGTVFRSEKAYNRQRDKLNVWDIADNKES